MVHRLVLLAAFVLPMGVIPTGVLPMGVLPVLGQERLVLRPESRLVIEGRSSVSAWRCAADGLVGTVQTHPGGPVEATLRLPVGRFDCGRRAMNADFARALRADRHPEMRYEVISADPVGTDQVLVTGHLYLAGTRRLVSVAAQGQREPDGTLRATGAVGLRMTDFGIEPPTALLGMVRAHDAITVRFDLVGAPVPLTRSD